MYRYVKRERAKAQAPRLVGERPYMEEISYRQQLFEKTLRESFPPVIAGYAAVSLAGRTHMSSHKPLVKAPNPQLSTT